MAGLLTENLTRVHTGEVAGWLEKTAGGAAHWAGTGPAGKTCRECLFMFGAETRARRDAGVLRSRACLKRERLSGARSTVVPHEMAACRYFDENADAPAATVPPRETKADRKPRKRVRIGH